MLLGPHRGRWCYIPGPNALAAVTLIRWLWAMALRELLPPALVWHGGVLFAGLPQTPGSKPDDGERGPLKQGSQEAEELVNRAEDPDRLAAGQ